MHLFLLFCALPVVAQDRYALVIGIDTYANVRPLLKARNDARSVDAALEQAGFASQLVLDPDYSGLLEALSEFVAQLGPGDEAIFYFAGHGVQIDGRNYLLTSDIPSVGPGDGERSVKLSPATS